LIHTILSKVHQISPSLESDDLEHRQESLEDVVIVRIAPIELCVEGRLIHHRMVFETRIPFRIKVRATPCPVRDRDGVCVMETMVHARLVQAAKGELRRVHRPIAILRGRPRGLSSTPTPIFN
jgi:hypothetical protein